MFEKFKKYKALVENEIGHKIKVLRLDNKGGFVFKKFDAFPLLHFWRNPKILKKR